VAKCATARELEPHLSFGQIGDDGADAPMVVS
jgi:hypothetical protein